MNAVVRNGCCEIRGGAGKPRVTLPPMNIDEAILHRDHVAVVLRNGYCQLYNTEGKLVTTYSVNDAKFVRFVGDDQLPSTAATAASKSTTSPAVSSACPPDQGPRRTAKPQIPQRPAAFLHPLHPACARMRNVLFRTAALIRPPHPQWCIVRMWTERKISPK